MRRLLISVLLLILAPLSMLGQTSREHVWGVGTLQGATTPSGRFASYYRDTAVTYSHAFSGSSAWEQMVTAGAAYVEMAGTDPTGDWTFDATSDGFCYTGPDSTFLINASLGVFTNTGAVFRIGFGVDASTPATTFVESGSGLAAFSTRPVAVGGILDVDSGECVTFWGFCTGATTCAPTLNTAGNVSILEVQPSGAEIQGTHTVSTASTYAYAVSATEIENGVIYATNCPSGTCTINLPPMTAGKRITVITDNSNGQFIIDPDNADQIVPLTDGLGDSVISAAATEGQEIVIISLDGVNLQGTINYGAWTDNN